jgi:hypothetical protein
VHDAGFLATKHLNGINIQRGTKTEKDGNGTVIPVAKKHP